jgi:hypothetical protein
MFSVYALLDPIDSEIRYIGVAKNANNRFRSHLRETINGGQSHKCNWIRSLLIIGFEPKLVILQTASTWEEGCEMERTAIKVARELECQLTNLTDGGEGMPNPSPETRIKLSVAHKKIWENPKRRIKHYEQVTNPEFLANLRALNSSPERRAKMSVAGKKRFENKEQREKVRRSQKRLWANPEHRAKLIAARKEGYNDPVRRSKHSASANKQWTNPGFRSKMNDILEAARRKRWADPEQRKQMSEDSKKRWADPERRKQMSVVNKKRYEDPELRLKVSIAVRKRYEEDPEYRKKVSAASKRNWSKK